MLGFPTETKECIAKTINCSLIFKANIIGAHITQPFPGSPLFENAISEGIIHKDVTDNYIDGIYGETFNEVWSKYIPNGITYEEFINARSLAYKKFYLHPQYIIKRMMRDIKSCTKLKFDASNGLSLLFKGRAKKDYHNKF